MENPQSPQQSQEPNQPLQTTLDAKNNAQSYLMRHSTGVLILIKKTIISLINFLRFSITQIIGQLMGKD